MKKITIIILLLIVLITMTGCNKNQQFKLRIKESSWSGWEENYEPEEVTNEFEKAITLRVIDTYWMEHINTMSHLKEGIFLRSYAQNDPLREYKTEGYELFEKLLEKIDAHKFSVMPVVNEKGAYAGSLSEGDILRYIKNVAKFDLISYNYQPIQ